VPARRYQVGVVIPCPSFEPGCLGAEFYFHNPCDNEGPLGPPAQRLWRDGAAIATLTLVPSLLMPDRPIRLCQHWSGWVTEGALHPEEGRRRRRP
jgi:hypothetical protein